MLLLEVAQKVLVSKLPFVKMHAEVEGKSMDEMHKAWADVPIKRFIISREVAKVILFLASEDSCAMTGQALNITGVFIMT